MSEFSTMLQQLQRTARNNAAASSSQSSSSSSRAASTKRRRSNDDEDDEDDEDDVDRRPTAIAKRGASSSSSFLPNAPSPSSKSPPPPPPPLSFLGIGAQKAGTTWLHDLLKLHPRLCLPAHRKELHFWDWNRRKGLTWYGRQFTGGRRSGRGEITPCYAVLDADVVEEIRSTWPSLRVVFLARDMVDRTWSALVMEARQKRAGLRPGEFLRDDDEKARTASFDYPSAVHSDDALARRAGREDHRSRTDYAASLRRWAAAFGRERVLVLDHREISRNPRGLIRAVCDFLARDDDDRASSEAFTAALPEASLRRRVHAAGDATARPSSSLRRALEDLCRPMARDFNALLAEWGYDWRLDEYDRRDVDDHDDDRTS